MTVLHEKAWGKLNLTLDVLGRRRDGYHDLQMVMTAVSLHDDITLELGTGRPWQVLCDKGEIPQGEGNLCWKAAKLYFAQAGLDPQGVTVCITKRIPAQAGMAGGSADAAAVLKALNRHYGCFSAEALRLLGLQVGSDVPFCLFGGTALAEGRGEHLTRLPALPENMYYVLVRPDFAVSTPVLFHAIDCNGTTERPDTQGMLAAIRSGSLPAIGKLLSNAFEPEVQSRFPVIEAIRNELANQGALGVKLTGTGSVVFGVFDGEAAAKAAKSRLEGRYPGVFTAKNV